MPKFGYVVNVGGEEYIVVSHPQISPHTVEKELRDAWESSGHNYEKFEEIVENLGYELIILSVGSIVI